MRTMDPVCYRPSWSCRGDMECGAASKLTILFVRRATWLAARVNR